MRTGKTVGSTVTKYNYMGSKLVQMTRGSNTLNFTYDSVGAVGVKYNGTQYYYLRNAQGDIMGIVNTSGTVVVEYTYDAWGRLLTTTGSMASTLGEINPLRYRGYVYDTETGLYYLESRYYNPNIGRFINADAFSSTGQGCIGYNLFAYRGIGSRVFKPDAHILHLSGKHHARGCAPGITETALRLTGSGSPEHPGSLQRHRWGYSAETPRR